MACELMSPAVRAREFGLKVHVLVAVCVSVIVGVPGSARGSLSGSVGDGGSDNALLGACLCSSLASGEDRTNIEVVVVVVVVAAAVVLWIPGPRKQPSLNEPWLRIFSTPNLPKTVESGVVSTKTVESRVFQQP